MQHRREHADAMKRRRPLMRLDPRNPFYQVRPNVIAAVLVAGWVVHVATRLVSGGVSEALTLMSSDVPEDVRDGANVLLGHLLSLQVHTLAITGLFALAGKFAERHDPPTVCAESHQHDVAAIAAIAHGLIARLPSDEPLVREAETIAKEISDER